jgi:hypothetical protein
MIPSKEITQMKSLNRTLSATLALIFLAAPPGITEPTQFGAGTKYGRVSGLPDLSPNLRKAYAQFRNDVKYFAAFAVNFETEDWFYIQNFHNLARVKEAAVEGCRQLSQTEGCTLYGVALPKSLSVSATTASGLSLDASEMFKARYAKHRKPGTYAAFAISGASHQGFGFDYEKREDAADTAIAYCNIGVAKDMAELGPDARKFARARGWDTCKVVDMVFTPKE